MATYHELMNSPVFLERRIQEQMAYLEGIQERHNKGYISIGRAMLLRESATAVFYRFKIQLAKINAGTNVQTGSG